MNNLTKKLLSQALDQCASGTLVVNARDPRCAICYANEAFTDLTGWEPRALVGQPLRDYLVSGDLPDAGADEVQQKWRTRTAAPVGLTLRVAPLYQRPGVPDYWLLSHVGPAAARGAHRGGPARTDPATGLPNRRVFEDLLRRDCGMARRDGRGVGLILFEVDALDAYRDVFGRHAVDASMRKVAHAIAGALKRSGDLAARLDADRFAALVGPGSESEIAAFAEDIAARVQDLAIHHPRSPVGRYVTVSTGIAAMVPTSADAHEEILSRAEADLAARQEQAVRQANG